MAKDSSVPLVLGLAGVGAVFLTSGITGNSLGQIFKGDFTSQVSNVPVASAASAAGSPVTGTAAAGSSGSGVSGSGIATPSLVSAPSDAPGPIINMVSWCNSVAGRFQYTWGGGHSSIGIPNAGACNSRGQGHCFGFDCSGAVSGALGAAGFLSAPLVSGDLANWGSPGRGKYVTVWANQTHTFMNILGHWFGTGKFGLTGGVDWGNFDPDLVAYSVRHPTGY